MNELNELYQESEKLRALQVRFLPNQVLFSEGDTSSEMYILLSGKVEILKEDKRIAIVEGEGSYLGELSTLLGIPRSATVKTMTACSFIVVDDTKVMDFFGSSPALGLKLARMLADRLVKMNVGHVKLEQKISFLGEKLTEANEKLNVRDRQIEQLVARIEKIHKLRS